MFENYLIILLIDKSRFLNVLKYKAHLNTPQFKYLNVFKETLQFVEKFQKLERFFPLPLPTS
jgi:hypothetical protein